MSYEPVFVDSAFEHFAGISSAAAEGSLDPNIEDSVGLVSYVVATTNPPPDEVRELYEQLRPVMKGLIDVVVSAVITRAGTDAVKLHDRASWRTPMEAMVKAFCSGFSETTLRYDERVRGADVPAKTIGIIMEAVPRRDAAVAAFTRFLQSEGEIINKEAVSGRSYQYACVSIVHKIFQGNDGQWLYVPTFDSYFTRFTPQMLGLTSSCGSNRRFLFKFDVDVMRGAFMTGTWESSPAFREQVNKFINRFQRTDIASSDNYFEDVFQSTGA